MAPILGILASANYQRVTSSYESIATTTLGSATATISFTSIPATYTHLQLRATLRPDNTAGGAFTAYAKFNSDATTGNYVNHGLYGNGASASSFRDQVTGGGVWAGYGPRVATTFGVAVMDILDYANTSKYKTVRMLSGDDRNGSGDIILISGLWMSTSAINRIDLTVEGGGNFATYTQYALYGIKGA
jgi:hypothetical protein